MPEAEKTYHCDGYYFDNVCLSRGERDEADPNHKRAYYICKTQGQIPALDYDLCPHCVEIAHLFHAPPRVLNSRVY